MIDSAKHELRVKLYGEKLAGVVSHMRKNVPDARLMGDAVLILRATAIAKGLSLQDAMTYLAEQSGNQAKSFDEKDDGMSRGFVGRKFIELLSQRGAFNSDQFGEIEFMEFVVSKFVGMGMTPAGFDWSPSFVKTRFRFTLDADMFNRKFPKDADIGYFALMNLSDRSVAIMRKGKECEDETLYQSLRGDANDADSKPYQKHYKSRGTWFNLVFDCGMMEDRERAKSFLAKYDFGICRGSDGYPIAIRLPVGYWQSTPMNSAVVKMGNVQALVTHELAADGAFRPLPT